MSDLFQSLSRGLQEPITLPTDATPRPMRRRCRMIKLLSVWIGISTALAACDTYELAFGSYVMDAAYDGMSAVRNDNAIVRGWIPEFLPETARTIRERHSLDTNEGWGTFAFQALDRETFESHWRKIPSAPLPRDPNRFREATKVNWWPERFGGDFVLYAGVEDRQFWIAVDFERKIGYFWQHG